ncbi:hexameric tyrosine-coordinated heme protein, partial [Rhizobium ruizarguesonis]
LMRSFLSDALRTTMSDPWLPSLITETPQAGFELAIKLSRMGVKMTQPSDEIRKKLRVIYEDDADSLIAASQVIAINYQTVAAANNYWR